MVTLSGNGFGKISVILFLAGLGSLLGCSENGGGSGSFVELQEASLAVNGQSVKAASLSQSGGQQTLSLSWSVRHASPDRTYRTRAYLGTSRFQTIEKLLEMKCGDQEGLSCGTEVTVQCQLGEDIVDCSSQQGGHRVFVGQPFTRLLIESCVYDHLLASFDKYACDTRTLDFAVFLNEDPRLLEYGGQIPEEWVMNGIPGSQETGGTDEENPDDASNDDTGDTGDTGEQVPLEENPLYLALQDNREKWTLMGSDSYLYTLNQTCIGTEEVCKDQEDIVVLVSQNMVVSAFFTPSGQALDAEQLAKQRTIEQWFDYIEAAINEASSLSVSYDEDKGYPTRIDHDPDSEKKDDEVTYTFRDFLF